MCCSPGLTSFLLKPTYSHVGKLSIIFDLSTLPGINKGLVIAKCLKVRLWLPNYVCKDIYSSISFFVCFVISKNW